MKHMTLDEALTLRNFILEKRERIAALERMIRKSRERYKSMNKEQLEEAVRDIAGMHREIEQHKKWCADAAKKVNEFFACPMVA